MAHTFELLEEQSGRVNDCYIEGCISHSVKVHLSQEKSFQLGEDLSVLDCSWSLPHLERSRNPWLHHATRSQWPSPSWLAVSSYFHETVHLCGLLWMHSNSSACFLFWGSRFGHSTPDGDSEGQRGQSPLLPCRHPSIGGAQDAVGFPGCK